MNIPIHELIGNRDHEDFPVEISIDQLDRADLAQLNCDLTLTLYSGVFVYIRRKRNSTIATVEVMVSALGWPVANNGRDEIFERAIDVAIGQLAAEDGHVNEVKEMQTDADTGFMVKIPSATGNILTAAVRDGLGQVFDRARALIGLAQGGPVLVNPV